jgi:hypothetical protein
VKKRRDAAERVTSIRSVCERIARSRFGVVVEPAVRQLEGVRWRSNLRRISEREVVTGLSEAKHGEPFAPYVKVVLARAA